MNKRYINKTYRSKRLRDTVNNISGTASNFTGGDSGGTSGLPYTLNDAGEYVIDNTIHSIKDIIAYSEDSNFKITSELTGNLNLWELLDVSITDVLKGAILVYDGKKWINMNQVTIDGGTYKGY